MGGRRRTIALAALGGLLMVAAGVASPALAAARPAPGVRILDLEFDGSTGGSGALTTGHGFGVRLLWAPSPDHSPEGTRIACVRANSIRGRAITKQTVSIGSRE